MSTTNTIICSLILTQLFLIATSISEHNNTTISLTNSNTTKINSTSTNTTIPINNNTNEIIIEGGGSVNLTERPAVNLTKPNEPKQEKEKTITVLATTQRTQIPIYEDTPIVANTAAREPEHKKITARKGVDFNETTVKPAPKKPTVTVPGEEEPYAPSHFQSNSKSNESSQNLPKVPLDILNNNQESTQKYVVPIVVVILSVPFVAIIISILYKRGAEWWRYRHYRRMDFLINGMYDG